MRIITLAIALIIGTAAQAQIIRAEPFYTAPQEAAVSGNLLLDDYPGATVAYSLRKLDKDYTGSAIRVRRSSDNTEQDIGFVNNYLDTAAMKTFVGNNNGFVVKIYDQVDTFHFVQSTANNQPSIITSGVINRDNGEVSITANGSTQYMEVPNSNDNFNYLHNGNISSIFAIVKFGTSSDPNNAYTLIDNGGSSTALRGYTIAYDDRASVARNNALTIAVSRFVSSTYAVLSTTTNKVTANQMNIITNIIDADNATAANRSQSSVNNSALFGNNSLTNSVSTSNASNNMHLFCLLNDSGTRQLFMVGSFQEMVIYASDKTSDIGGINSNMNAFYSIY